MCRQEGMKMKKLWLGILLLISCVWFAMPFQAASLKKVSLYDANYKESKPVKVGSYYYRVTQAPNPENTDAGAKMYYERSKKKKSGYTRLVTVKGYADIYYTNGKQIFYISPKARALYKYDLKQKKSKRITKLGAKSQYTSYSFHGAFGSKLYVMSFNIRHKLNKLICYNVKTGKKSTVLENQVVWNSAADTGRYLFLTEGTDFVDKNGSFTGADGRPHRFYVYDKKTQETWDVTEDGYAGMSYAAGGGDYGKLGNFGVYAVYDAGADRWEIYKYTFSSRERKQIGEINQAGEKFGMMWAGKKIFVSYQNTSGEDKNVQLDL